MFKQLKLGTRIALGFAVLVVIAIALGGLSIWDMRYISGESAKLSDEFIPEVVVANSLERHSLLTMYNMRGYAMSEEEKYNKLGTEELALVKKALTTAEELASRSPHLVKLAGAVDNLEAEVQKYESLAGQTAVLNQRIAQSRVILDSSAQAYMQNCDSFLASQNESMVEEIRTAASSTVTAEEEQASSTGSAQLLERHEKITLVNDIIGLGNATRIACFKSQALRDPAVMAVGQKNFAPMREKFAALRKLTRRAEELQKIDATEKAAQQYETAMAELLGAWNEMQTVSQQRGAVGDEVLQKAQMLADAGMNQTTEIATETRSMLAGAMSVLTGGLAAAVVIGVLLSIFITRGITKPVNRIISSLSEGAKQVTEAASQVSVTSQQLAEGASEQASSLEETSSALEEMAAMTRTNAENSRVANELSEQTGAAAQAGDQTMGRLNSAMTAINESSGQIQKIIKVIEEIAFQTNLLALNAAVEAARAGEHGKGFAVVAEEVRNLAQRAAEAARETTALIDTSVERAREGSSVATEVADALSQIVGNVGKVSDLISGIARASQEQAQGVEQVNTAVAQMDKVTQGNAAGAEESASAAEELSAQAATVNGIVEELAQLVHGARQRPAASSPLEHTHVPAPRDTTRRLVPGVRRAAAPAAAVREPQDVSSDVSDF